MLSLSPLSFIFFVICQKLCNITAHVARSAPDSLCLMLLLCRERNINVVNITTTWGMSDSCGTSSGSGTQYKDEHSGRVYPQSVGPNFIFLK